MTNAAHKFIIQGQGGGSKKGGGSSSDDTMRSFAHARLVDAISEGEIEGLVDGENSILINKTPLPNIKEAAMQFRPGLPDDEPMIGVNTTEAYVNVGTEISQELGPIVRTITDTNIDGIKLLMQLNTLYRVDTKKGGLKTTDSGWKIEIRRAGGSWELHEDFNLNAEKASSPVQFQHIIPTTGTGPWDIRISARFGDRDDIEQNISWVGYSTITGGRFIHPHTAMVALALSSEHVGASTPTRHYHVLGRKILVPTNYNPLTRVYSGIWDGTFKRVWSDNPAWVFYDMVDNDIFGIGAEIDPSVANKWRLYTIAQYCDQLVPSGYRDDDGNMTMEPRFTFNGTITDKKEAFDALRSMTTVWRGMGFYALNQFFTSIDMPQDVAHIYGPSNVVDGRFEYSTSSIKARHSVVMVRFNDPNNLFEPAIEPYVDDELLKKFGWREKTLELAGCASRSLAHRYGKWVTETEKRETETVTFQVGLDSIHALPGEVIAISDPRRAQARMSGRVRTMNKAARTVQLDQDVNAAITGSLTLRIQGNDGQLRSFTGTVNASNRSIITVTNSDNFDFLQVNAVFIISSNQVAPREYRIITIDEEAGNKFKITALQYDRMKYAAVENGIEFEPLPVKLDVNTLEAPSDLAIENRAYTDGGRVRNDLEITWSPSPSLSVVEYRIYADTPTENNILIGRTSRSAITYTTYEPGAYTFRVVAASITNATSDPMSISYTVEGAGSIAVGSVMDLVNAATMIGGSNVEFKGSAVRLSWRNMMKVSSVAGIAEVDTDDTIYSHTTLEFYFGATKVRTQRVQGNTFTYTLEMNRADASAAGLSTAQRSFSVRAYVVDKDGRVSAPTTISLVNNAPPAIAPSVVVEENFLNITWPVSDDEDIAGYLVFVRDNNGSVAGATPTEITVSNSYRFQGISLTDYWISVVGYDAFGRNSLNYATPYKTTTGFDGMDVTPPDSPTGLTLNGTLNPKTGQVDVVATWTAVSESDVDQYQFEVNVEAVRQVLTTNENKVKFSMAQASSVQARVRVMDKTFNWSEWSAVVAYTSPSDSVAPATPTGLVGNAGFGTIWLKWNANTEPDFARYEVYESLTTTNPTAASTASFSLTSTELARVSMGNDTNYYHWVRAVDMAGNKSPWTARLTTKTPAEKAVTTADLQGLINATSLASGLALIEIVDALPGTPHVEGRQVFLKTDRKLYKNTGSGWSKEVDGADLKVNSIDAGVLRAGVVGATELAAGAAVISKLGIMDWMNLVPGADLADPAAWVGENGSSLAIALSPSVTNWEGQRVINQSGGGRVVGLPFGVDAGAKLWVRTKASVTMGSAVTAQLRIYFFEDATTPAANAPYIVNIGTTTATGATEIAGEVEVPAGCTYARLVLAHISGSGTTRWGAMAVRRKNGGELIIDGTVKANHLTTTTAVITGTVQIADAIITDAKIATLSAAKLIAGTALAATITVSGTALSTIGSNAALGAQNPATRINAGTTNIDPGRVVISGSRVLSDWRGSTDTTTINGGMLETDSVNARSVKVGLLQNLVQNGDFSDTSVAPGSYWATLNGTLAWNVSETYMGSPSLMASKTAAASSHNIYLQSPKRFPVVSGERIAVSAVIKGNASAANGFRLRVYWYNAAGTALSAPDQFTAVVPDNQPITTSWVKWEGQVVAPAGAASAEVRIFNHSNQTTATVLYIGQVKAQRTSGTVDIADGAITAEKVSVTTLSAISATIGILRTATSGARMEIHTDKILVYDESNILRVRIGNLA